MLRIKKSLYFLVLIGLALSILGYFQLKKPVKKFSHIYLSDIGTGNIPCFEVEVDKKTFDFGLDLGLDADLGGSKELIEQISDKSLERIACMFGIRGRRYQEPVYSIPYIKLGSVTFRHPLINELDPAWEEEATLDSAEKGRRLNPIGLIGWRIFQTVVVFLNFKESYIAIAKSMDDLERKRFIGEAIRVPLTFDHGFLEIDVHMSNRTLKCMLDTGCTNNLIHGDEKGSVTVEDFRIGEKKWTPTRFLQESIEFPVKVDAILGMDFFIKHQVVIDFPNREVFFLP
ncbi:MAG TPA: hypothetical protein PKW79_06225 [Rhabdochlamydiaceae bacterium]|nr:hypothetical protein [Rhabdochlamydiaceae bacterium]